MVREYPFTNSLTSLRSSSSGPFSWHCVLLHCIAFSHGPDEPRVNTSTTNPTHLLHMDKNIKRRPQIEAALRNNNGLAALNFFLILSFTRFCHCDNTKKFQKLTDLNFKILYVVGSRIHYND